MDKEGNTNVRNICSQNQNKNCVNFCPTTIIAQKMVFNQQEQKTTSVSDIFHSKKDIFPSYNVKNNSITTNSEVY